MKTIRQPVTNEQRQNVNFGFYDRFNREIGTQITTFDVAFTSAPEDAMSYWTVESGNYKGLNVWATRNNAHYGAIQHDRYFTTDAERAAAIAKYLREARNRAARIH